MTDEMLLRCHRAVFLLTLGFNASCGNTADARGLQYSVLEQQDISVAGIKRLTYRVEVSTEEIPTQAQMRSTAEQIWRDGNREWDEFTIFFYLPGMNTSSVAYVVAEYSPRGLTELQTHDGALYGTRWRSLEAEAAKADSVWGLKTRNPGVREYKLVLATNEVAPRRVMVRVETNFPEGTNLLVTADRNFYERNNEEIYAGQLFERDVAVTNGRIELEFLADDSPWYSERKANERKFAGMGVFGEIARISDTVEVRVLFSPRRAQVADVLRRLGENGDFVRGNGARRVGDFTTVDVMKQVVIPFRP